MTIESCIQNQVLLPRLREKGVLVVYDPDRRYRDVCHGLASTKIEVVDASESSILAREKAQELLMTLGSSKANLEGMLVYSPLPRPQDDEQMQRDPFALYVACGRVFPDGEGDTFENICLKATPEHAVEIRKLFAENPSPSFEVVNQIGGGPGWPQLQALLGANSAREILLALLAPTAKQRESLRDAGDSWIREAKELLASCLGLKLLTKGKSLSSVADELWRFLLFSEFCFDLPTENDLPPELSRVPRAGREAKVLVESVCDTLRNDQRSTPEYVQRAEGIEADLNLRVLCSQIKDLGVLDTFPFEERTFMAQAQAALASENLETVRKIVRSHKDSVWKTKGENQAQWGLIVAALDLIERCEDLAREFPGGVTDMASLIHYYVAQAGEADRLHREFEQAVESFLDDDETMAAVIGQARRVYRGLIGKVHNLFVRYLEEEGWPTSGIPANADTFDRCVAPLLAEKGTRVAVFLVDALRYELGVALKRQIDEFGQTEMDAACAALPSVTPVGMASLLPEAGGKLTLVREGDEMVPALGGARVPRIEQRIRILMEKYGQRLKEMSLAEFVRPKKTALPEAVDLLVLRTTDLDAQMERSSQFTVPATKTLLMIRNAIYRLRRLGFVHVIIATDHGFVLNSSAEAGDTCAKPPGDWLLIHERAVLGTGTGDQANLVLPAAKVGIRGDFECFGMPRNLIPYRSTNYFHGGVSLQEALVPVIRVRVNTAEAEARRDVSVRLTYRHGATKITTQRPVIEAQAEVDDLFGLNQDVEALIVAHDLKGNVVGEAVPGGVVDAATRVVRLSPGTRVQVPLKMVPLEDFEGKFTVRAINPETQATYGEGLRLETDYAG